MSNVIPMAKKCLVHGCLNRSDGGTFVSDLCASCHEMITTGNVHHANPTFIGDLSRTIARKNKLLEASIVVMKGTAETIDGWQAECYAMEDKTIERCAAIVDVFARQDHPSAVTVCDLAASAIRELPRLTPPAPLTEPGISG